MLEAGALATGGGLWLASLLAFAGGAWWPLDLLAHFRVQYLVLATVLAALCLLARRRRTGMVIGACAALNAAVVLPYLVPSRPEPVAARAKLISMNVLTSNPDHDAVRRFVRRERPDLLLLMEVDERWMQDMADLRREYPYGVVEARSDNFGIALLSRHPCSRCEVVHLGPDRLPSVVGEFMMPDRVTLVGTHPLPPLGSERARSHDLHLRAVGDYIARVQGPVILAGDLNTTPWSARFRRLLGRTGLRDSGAGHGVGRTWPADNALLGITIDHFLSTGGVHVTRRERGPNVGSDHFPLIVEFALGSD
ncbi:MAG TPA: endonuclease/exonuclease/phosphatase family protein [Longimicrobium sp.]|jgi:endonuclease/exonuclease/phosphatase (EEP) superfamily protein YafD|uniref:endonuclease/exonuclease/phosphatase family protein n=1 Tax=Longimicrobium sp. TaxID=2029185 RepID=UPI002ED94405